MPEVRHGLTVLLVATDEATRALFPKVVLDDRLQITDDLAKVIALAQSDPPDVAFVEIGMGHGAGLAIVHHLKALVPDTTVFALASRTSLEAAANAVALGGAGLIILPAGGDEVQGALEGIKARNADRALRDEVERTAALHRRLPAWLNRLGELSESASRTGAAVQLLEILSEATEARGAVVYLSVGERSAELVRAATSPACESSPPAGMEPEVLEYARREKLFPVPLVLLNQRVGLVLLLPSRKAPPSSELLSILSTQAATTLALVAERERAGGALIKDPASSAYSFAYYVDVAGREIDKARRYNRRFAVATVAFEASFGTPPLGHAEMADQLLKSARDTDVLAQVDEHEFHLLMPETDGLGAHSARRRVFARLAERIGPVLPPGLLVGVASFPHDGADLSQLLRVARRRAEATRTSLVRSLNPDRTGLFDLLDVLQRDLPVPPAGDLSAPRVLELPISEAAALAAAVVADGLRGGATFLTVAHHEKLSLGAAVRTALGPLRDNVTLHAVDVRPSAAGEDIEALAVLAEHGAYALVARHQQGVIRGLHAADPLLAEVLTERLGKAAGLRLFG